MTESYSLGLALFNFLPNLIFLAGAAFLARWMTLLGMRADAWIAIAGATIAGITAYLLLSAYFLDEITASAEKIVHAG